jgi:hypothetical protein
LIRAKISVPKNSSTFPIEASTANRVCHDPVRSAHPYPSQVIRASHFILTGRMKKI